MERSFVRSPLELALYALEQNILIAFYVADGLVWQGIHSIKKEYYNNSCLPSILRMSNLMQQFS